MTKTNKHSALCKPKNACNARALFLIALLFFSCTSTNQNKILQKTNLQTFNFVPEWKEVTQIPNRVLYQFDYIQTTPPLIVHCIKINLKSKNLKIQVHTPNNSEFNSLSKFAKKIKPAVAFNTTPYTTTLPLRLGKKEPLGITISNGKIISKPCARYGCIAFWSYNTETTCNIANTMLTNNLGNTNATSKANAIGITARIFDSQNLNELNGALYACGGFWTILRKDKEYNYKDIKDARTVVGINDCGTTLFVVAVEGSHNKKSEGLSYNECSNFLKTLGATTAIELDGGSSTDLFIQGASVLSYKNNSLIPCFIGFLWE